MTAHEYRVIFAERQPAPHALTGVCGRVIRAAAGKTPEYLSYPVAKRLAWVIGPDGLAAMVGRTGLQILLELGIKPDRIADNLNAGMRWVLAVFPDVHCTRATWEGLFGLIAAHYPAGVGDRLRRWAGVLVEGSALLDGEQKTRYGSPAVREYPGQPDHMTPERYLAGADTPANAWLFLWHSVGVNDLYTGTEFCRDACGRRGHTEYLAANVRVSELADAALVELDVRGDALTAGWPIAAPTTERR